MDFEKETLELDERQRSSYCEGFVKDVTKLIQNQAYHDVELKCADGVVSSSKLLLASRSDYFKALFDFENQQTQSGRKSVDLSQFNFDLVQVIVDTLIHLDDDKIASVDGIKLLEISNYLQMNALTIVACKRIAKKIDAETVIDVYKIAKKFSNLQLKNFCVYFVGKHIFEVHEEKRLSELEKEDLDQVIKTQMNPKRINLEDFIDYVKNFYKVMKDLDRIEEFKNFIKIEHHRKLIYFALTFDRSVIQLGPGEDIVLTDKMKIDPKSEMGEFLAPMCPTPHGNILSLLRIGTDYWTHKYGDLSEQNLELGPEWKVEGDFQKIKFYNTRVGSVAQIICGLEITLKDGSIHRVGNTSSPFYEDFDRGQMELLRLGICVSEESQLILAIQVNCFNKQQTRDEKFFFPHDQHDLPFERQAEGHSGMDMFGYMDRRLRMEMIMAIIHKSPCGIKGKTVTIDGRPIICELQVKYSGDKKGKKESDSVRFMDNLRFHAIFDPDNHGDDEENPDWVMLSSEHDDLA